MEIKLKNIGIIKDSTIKLNGLTVVTGQNNSGKTTVGKVIYSLIDAVSNINQKASSDKYYYAITQIEKAYEEFSFRLSLKRAREDINNECLQIFFSNNYDSDIDRDKIENYLLDLIHELEYFNIDEEPYRYILERYSRPSHFKRNSSYNFEKEKTTAISILKDVFEQITCDPELINYIRQSINTTLSTEFYGQIQPAALNNVTSLIEVTNNDMTCFNICIKDNEVCDNDQPIFVTTPYKKSYLIDNPFILDEPPFRKATKYTSDNISFVNESRILTHENKLKFIINSNINRSIFEEDLIDKRYKEIMSKIDAILPGEFTVSDGDRYYIHNDVKLKSANLATGSKMFSIIKMLISKGEIDESTLLILDEPEAHLHPKWQNLFAELIILLVKEIGCNILLTTHSSNFMLAIDAYMRKYDISTLCNFYQTEHYSDSIFVDYKCVNNSLDLIYKDFVTYLSDVKMLRNDFLDNSEE